MKIILLSNSTPSLFHFRLDMMLAFVRQGCEVVAVGDESEVKWETYFKARGIRYRCIRIQRNGLNPFADLSACWRIRRLLKEEKPDKIFSNQAKMVIYGGIAANSLGFSEVYPLIAGLGSVFLASGLKGKLIQTIVKQQYKLAMRKSPKVFFQNPDDAGFFTENKIVPEEKIVFLNGSGVNLDKFKVQPFPVAFGYLCVSRLIKDKGIVEYLKACRIIKKNHPHVRCLLVGPYDTNPSAIRPEELKPYIDDGSVEYFGEQDDVYPYLAQCTVFVLPSYREGTPKSVLEAMACGKAIVTTDAPGCRETVTDGVNGFLVPVKNCDALVEKMLLLYGKPSMCERMGKESRRIVEQKFDVRLVNQKILKTMQIGVK